MPFLAADSVVCAGIMNRRSGSASSREVVLPGTRPTSCTYSSTPSGANAEAGVEVAGSGPMGDTSLFGRGRKASGYLNEQGLMAGRKNPSTPSGADAKVSLKVQMAEARLGGGRQGRAMFNENVNKRRAQVRQLNFLFSSLY